MANTDFNSTPSAPPPAMGGFGQRLGQLANLLQQRKEATEPQVAPPPPPMPGQAPAAPPAMPQVPLASTTKTALMPPPPAPPTAPVGYIPPRGERPGSELGKPWWPVESARSRPGPAPESQFIPPPRDAYRYVGQVAAGQAKFGAPAVAGPAQQVSMLAAGFAPLFDLISGGAFSRGFSEGNALQIQKKLGALKLEQEQFVLQSEMMQQAHQNLLLQYGDVFNAAEKGWITEDEAAHRIRVIAGNNQDGLTQQAIADYGLKGALSHLQREDRQMRIAMAGTTSLKKMTEGEKSAAEEMASQGYKTDISGQGLDASSAFSFPGLEGGEKAGGEQDGTAIAQADTGEAEGGDDAEAFDAMEQKKHTAFGQPITPETIQLGRQAYNGSFDPKELKATRGLVEGVAADLRHSISKITTGPGDAESKLERVEKLDPTAGARLRGLLDLSLNPEKDLQVAHGVREDLVAQAHAINPNWKSNSYALKEQYEKLNQPAVKTVQRVGAFLPAVNSLNSTLLDIPEDQKIPENILKKVYANQWTGDAAYGRIYTAIQNVLNETSAIQSGTGQSHIGNVKMRAQEMLNTMSPAQIRTQLILDAQSNYGMIKNIENQYKQTVGDPSAQLPFFPKAVEDDYKSIMRMNPYTGEMPEDASGAVRATSKKGGSHPSWLNNDPNSPGYQGWKPLTEAQVVAGRRQIAQNQNSTDPNVQAAIQRIRRRLGEFASAQPGDPDYGEEQQQQSVAR
jgi:hypothetical protein